MTKFRRYILIFLLIAVVTFSTCLFSSCNPEYEGSKAYGVYMLDDIVYDENTNTMTVFVSLTQDENKKLEGVEAEWHYQKVKDGSFKFRYIYSVNFSPEAIFSAVDANLTQEQRKKDDLDFDVLKVAFRYGTIYKSMKSDGEVSKSGRYYFHDFALDQTQSGFETTLTITTQNSAAWYGLLISAAAIVFGVILLVILLGRKKYADKERTKDNQ